MITTIRAQFKQSTYRYVALFIVFAFALGMVSLPTLIKNEKEATSWAIQVNGQKVSYQDFARTVAEQSELLAHVRAQYGQYADLLLHAMNMSTDPRALAFDKLIKDQLITQAAREMDIQLDPKYISRSINDARYAQQHLPSVVPSFLFNQSGGLNSEKLMQFLQHIGLSVKTFEEKVEQVLKNIQAMNFVTSTCYIPAFDFKHEAIATALGKQFSYISFSLQDFLAAEKKNKISDEELLAFYNKQNMERRHYWVSEKRSGTVWKFDAKSYGASISDAQISQYYEDNKVSKYILDPVKVRVRIINEKQLSSSDVSLETVRQELVNNPASTWAKEWTSLEPFARGEKKGALEQEAFLLRNNGDISPVVETKDGKVIIQLVDRTARTYKPITLVKREIQAVLMEKEFKKSFVKDLKSVASGNDAKAIELFIAQKGAKKDAVIGVTKNDTRMSQELFDLKKNEYGFFVEDGIGFAVLLTDIVEKNLPEFASIKEVVKEDLCEDRAKKMMHQTVQDAKNEVTRSSLENIQKKFNGSLERTGMLQATDQKKMQELDKKGLPVRTMLRLDTVGSILVHQGEDTSFLIKLDAIEQHDEAKLISAQKEIKNRFEATRKQLAGEAFVASLRRDAIIKTNDILPLYGE